MPELPEVHTTVTGLQKVLPGSTITDLWSDMWSTSSLAKNTIKDRGYFPYFKKHTVGATVQNVTRRAKYILIHLDNDFTVVIHMKMTGHLMYGKYEHNKHYNGREWSWAPIAKNSPLNDPFNRHIHVVFTLSKKRSTSHVAFCDSRKFGTMQVIATTSLHEKLSHLGPEPLETSFTFKEFIERMMKYKNRPIKAVLMDQRVIAGIGNIYSDEMLHLAHILPTRTPQSIYETEWRLLFKHMREVLRKGINFGGDSMSDYRNIEGARGEFQQKHRVYLRTHKPCLTKGCDGIISKTTIAGRSAHFCPACQH